LGLTPSVGIVLTGLAILGFGVAGTSVPPFQEIIYAMNEAEKRKTGVASATPNP